VRARVLPAPPKPKERAVAEPEIPAESERAKHLKPATPPILIVRKSGSHGGHHGGAWKVAYADFVTAMMALFIVLWLLNSSAKVKEAVAGYFNDPTGYGKQLGSGQAGSGEALALKADDMKDLMQKFEQAMKEVPEFEQIKGNVRMSVTGEGLRIELLEDEKGIFFQSGNPTPTTAGENLLINISRQLGKLPNSVLIEGHTDAKPFSKGGSYGNWELSSDRANSARRLMESNGLRRDQVVQVRGFASHQLFKKDDPADPSNRRISVIVAYNAPPSGDKQAPDTKGTVKAEPAVERSLSRPQAVAPAAVLEPAAGSDSRAAKPAPSTGTTGQRAKGDR